jgi:YVTN family beta-propeller protein
MDANNLVIIDLSTDEVVAELAIFNRPGRVRISPDSEEAYVLNVAGTDRISFVDLDGENSSIIVQRSAGQTGSANGYTYTETSGIELSDDGSVLAVCDSFNDLLRIFDTASRTQIDAVTVGDFPIRAAFSPSGDRIYVTNAFGDSVSVVENDQGVWSNIGTVPNIDFPLTVNVDAGDTYVYVGNSGSNPAVRVIDTGSLNVVGTLPFADGSPRDTHLCRAQGTLYVAATNGELVRIDAAGAGSSIIDATPLESGPSDLAFNEATQTAMTAQPVPDGVDIVTFGMTGDIDGDGDVDVDDLLLLLSAWGTNDPDADLDGSGTVDVDDLLLLLSNWG